MSKVFILNPYAREGHALKAWKKVEHEFKKELKDEFKVYITEKPEHVTKIVEEEGKNGASHYIAIGGEGTMCSVINAVYKNGLKDKATVGVVPFGNMNDYAMTIRLKKSWEAALDMILHGEERKVSVGKVILPDNSIYYGVNVFDAGLSALAGKAHAYEKKFSWLKGRIKYQLIATSTLMNWKNIQANVYVDNELLSNGEIAVIVTGFSYTLGGFYLLPHAHPFADQLAITIGQNLSKLRTLTLMNKAKKNVLQPKDNEIIFAHGKNVKVEAQEPLALAIDGEVHPELLKAFEIQAIPKDLKFMFPKKSPLLTENEELLPLTLSRHETNTA